MNICVDARMIHASGIGTYLQNILPALSRQYSLTLIGKAEEIADGKWQKIPTSIPIYSVAEILRFPKLIPYCDIFWSPHYNVPLLPVRARKRLVTIHDVFHLAFFNTLTLKQKAYAWLAFRTAARASQQIITVSEFSRSEIARYLSAPPEKISVIYNGVNHELFRKTSEQASKRVQKNYRLPARYLLYVGNVKPHKNLISLLKAFDMVKEAVADTHLVIVGKKEGFITGESAVFQLLEQNKALSDRILFTGFVATEDLPALYSMASLFVFPSLYEGFGLPPLEAMACGCPVLVAEKASMPEICGTEAAYVDPEHTHAFAMKIQEMLSLPEEKRKEISRRGIQHAATYTWKQAAKQHISLINKLLTS